MQLTIRNVVFGSIALVFFFLIAATLILPHFRTTYETGFGSDPYPKANTGTHYTNNYCVANSTSLVTCTDCNSTTGYEAFLSTCSGLTVGVTTATMTANNTHCWGCSDWGFKTSSQGLNLLVLVLGLLSVAFIFIKAIKIK